MHVQAHSYLARTFLSLFSFHARHSSCECEQQNVAIKPHVKLHWHLWMDVDVYSYMFMCVEFGGVCRQSEDGAEMRLIFPKPGFEGFPTKVSFLVRLRI